MWWCGGNLICFGGVFFWCRNGDFECECGTREDVSGLRFVGLFRGGFWAGLIKS